MAVESGTNRRTVRGACPHDCPDTCAMLIDLEDGRAVKVRGNPDHPFTRGFLCKKVSRYVERTYSPDRVLHPMRRKGPKGAGRFEPITWDEALDEIATRFKEIAESADGPEAILPYSYAGTMGLVQSQSIDRRFFHRLGASLLDRTICATAGGAGYSYTIGARIGTDPETVHLAKLIIIWGSNVITSNVHLWPQILEARRRGARIIAIDPYRCRTAAEADEHLQLRPGSDAALALGMMNVILNEGLEDREYIEKFTIGIERLRERAQQYSPDRVAEITGLTKEQVINLVREYARSRPSFIRINYGLQRHRGGGMAVRAIACLPALVGAWRDAGGGIILSTSSTFPLNYHALERPDLIKGNPRTINMSRLGEALTEARPPVRALYVYNSNPAAVAPDLARVIRGLKREDLFTVVHEQFPTDTTDYADIVLPATTQLEHFDIIKPYGHLYLMLNQPAIEPLGEAKSNSEVFRLLAARMGFTEDCFKESDEEIAASALKTDHPWLKGITLDALKRDGYARLNLPPQFVPFAEGQFPTPSGRCEFFSEQMIKDGLDPVPDYTPPLECREVSPELYEKYPIQLLSPPAHSFLNSTFANLPFFIKDEKEPIVEINAEDAKARNISDGETVRVFNDRGELRLTAYISDRVRAGVAVAPSIWWNKLSPHRRNVNWTTSENLTDMGGGATFYDNLVQIEGVMRNAQ